MKVSRSHEHNIAILKRAAASPPGLDVKKRWTTLKQQNISAIVQRTPEWFARRRGKFTGSKWSNFFFLGNEEEYHLLRKRTFGYMHNDERVFAPGEVFDAVSKKRMAYGTQFEDNAAADCLLRLPNCIGLEASILPHPTIEYLASSPDGTINIYDDDRKTFDTVAFEIKCPSQKLDKRSGKMKYKSASTPIWYYMPQIFMEMIATGTKATIFQVWNAEKHKVWYIRWNQQYYEFLLKLIAAFKEDSVTFSEFSHMKKFVEQYSKLICKNAVPLHVRGGFVSKITDPAFDITKL
jgi:hypothetical protein|tara:strand:+ start:131 stop:1009 length:879 start_codon:yes stop_codon:yes gene_type:complete